MTITARSVSKLCLPLSKHPSRSNSWHPKMQRLQSFTKGFSRRSITRPTSPTLTIVPFAKSPWISCPHLVFVAWPRLSNDTCPACRLTSGWSYRSPMDRRKKSQKPCWGCGDSIILILSSIPACPIVSKPPEAQKRVVMYFVLNYWWNRYPSACLYMLVLPPSLHCHSSQWRVESSMISGMEHLLPKQLKSLPMSRCLIPNIY